MIAWSIEAAHDAGCFDRVIVSTDDLEIAEVAKDCGADVPFIRETELSGDFVATKPVVADGVRQLSCHPNVGICCLYATAPFVTAADLKRSWIQFSESDAEFLMAVTSFAYPVQRALRMTKGGMVSMADPSKLLTRSQDLEEMWHDAGQFYWGWAGCWVDENKEIFSSNSYGYSLPRHRVQDIDTEEDLIRAEAMKIALTHLPQAK